MMGQCQTLPDGSQLCRTDQTGAAWKQLAVRVEAVQPGSTGWGSGIIVAGDRNTSLVLTNRHVVSGGHQIIVHHLGTPYSARVLQVSPTADLAALEVRIPGPARSMDIASEQPQKVWMFGFDGRSGQFHKHTGTFRRAFTSGDVAYSFVAHSGDSGSGIINERGELAGIQWGASDQVGSAVVSASKIKAFVMHETTCRFFQRLFRPRQPQSINVEVNTPAPIAPVSPAAPVTVNDPVTVAPTPVQPAAPAFDPTPLLMRLDAVEKLAAQTAAAVQRPITFVTPNPDGTMASQPVQLGGSLGFKIPNNQALIDRVSALEAKVK